MTEKRSYRLLCPIARALDVVGDRWTLLILRDLHAGPARYQELEKGLGLATNLLSTRLTELTEAGLIHKPQGPGRSAYELTELGRRTDRILWELARYGSLLDADPEPREPGNLRTMALPLRIMLETVTPRPELIVRLLVDQDTFTISSTKSGVEVEYGQSDIVPDLTARLEYEPFLALGEGRIEPAEFFATSLEIVDGSERRPEFLSLFAAAIAPAAESVPA